MDERTVHERMTPRPGESFPPERSREPEGGMR